VGAAAQMNIATLYEDGLDGLPQDYAAALKWYGAAFEQGEWDAANSLARLYAEGLGVPQDYAKAVQYWQAAAEQDDDEALYNLGVCYDDGLGVKSDYARAAQYYRQAAELGNSDAMVNLAMLYQEGYGVEKDEAVAAQWFRQAAELGDADGQLNLGLSYAEGSGVECDYQEAQKWWRLAAEQGNKEAVRALATDQLSGNAPRISAVVSANTNNPAEICKQILLDSGVDKEKIMPSFEEWGKFCKEKGYTCNIVFDSEQSVRQALDSVSLLGRASIIQAGSKFDGFNSQRDGILLYAVGVG